MHPPDFCTEFATRTRYCKNKQGQREKDKPALSKKGKYSKRHTNAHASKQKSYTKNCNVKKM